MSTAALQSYTNEFTPELLRSLDVSPFSEQQLAEFSEEALNCVREQQAYRKAHPPVAIYRFATEGSQTRDGGVIEQTNSSMTIVVNNGQQVRVAHKGDYAVYPDGRRAKIVTGAGNANSDFALVGSVLSNGDKIINTPQHIALFLQRDGEPLEVDFLPVVKA
ncbi:hypothetical protein AUC61_03330 [Pseudomonas sp. S25]|uniref:PAAR motif-containing protein n=1 Tax=Pseudomonas maioricensis TaxID=1766623 RepID=A0ABS9ZD79_9PSED|nr:hypothetical protein [Pseudomonas sp. S25]MCI8208559.1 hypothetical protein [Pseudomonas sp. S25]